MIEQVTRALSGRYRIERELGQGGMALVYLAEDLKHERQVAVKVLRPDLAATLGSERFLREIVIAARLNHPHILPVHDSGDADGVLYYVMPVVEGESLRQKLSREKQLPVDEALDIASQVASALDYAHRQGVVHRDVKPENIMLHQGEAMVMDFGIALAVTAAGSERLTGTGLAVGTPSYMSPEQATGSETVDPRSDVYSLGCLVYEMLAGEPPFTGPTPQAIMARSLTGEAPKIHPVRRAVPVSIDATVAKALSPTPADRYASAGALVAALSRGMTAPVPGRSEPRSRRTLVTAAVAILVLAGGVFWMRPGAAAGSVTPGTEVIAVLPFNTLGEGVEVLEEGMIDLLSTGLDGIGGIRTVDPGTVMGSWRRRAKGDAGLQTGLAVGRDVGAGSILTGSAVQAGTSVRLTADLYLLDGQKAATATVDGPADSVLALVDSLSLRLVRGIWRAQEPMPALRVSAMTTGSVDAIRAYLRGEQFYRRAVWDSAIVAFEEAVRIDSTFALAYARLGFSHGWVTSMFGRPFLEATEAAYRLADRLPEREHSLVIAGQFFSKFSLEALDSARAYVNRYPDDPDGWFLLADVQFHAQPLLALTPEDTYIPFERAAELNPSLAAALVHPLELSLNQADSSRFHRYVERYGQAGGELPPYFKQAGDITWNRSDTSRSVARRLFRETPLLYARFPELFYHSPVLSPDDLLAGLEAGSTTPHAAASQSPGFLHQRVGVLLSMGRLERARVLADSLAAIDPNAAVDLQLSPLFTGYAPPTYAERVAHLLTDLPQGGHPWLRVLTALSLRRLDDARQEIAEREARGVSPDEAPYERWFFEASKGWLAVLEADTATGVEQMRAALGELGFGQPTYAMSSVRFQLAAALAAQPATRNEGIRRLRHGFMYSPAYRPVAHLLIAHALEAAGDRTGAAQAYAEVVRLWKDADPELQPLVREIRAALARLSAEPVT